MKYAKIKLADELYPSRLREIKYPPKNLYVEGDLSLLKERKMIAVVGTRRMTREGEGITRKMVRGLVKRGWVIVSGLARGVDRVAHEECLRWGGKMVAVLAHGLDITYPIENEKLRKRIVEAGGLVVSEYEVGVKPEPKKFAIRNRIVAGLSQAVLVTESYVKSGTKITVGFALDQGKDVFVAPGLPDKPSFRGNIEMIQEGAWPILDVEEIMVRVRP